jgi:hypothetical protein
MYMFDIETTGKQSTSAILSFACIHFDADEELTHEELRKRAFFVKLDAKDQIKRLKRSITKSSLEWWAKQCENAKKKSLYPSNNDVKLEDGLEMFRQWAKQFDDYNKSWVWARGNLDQLVLDSVEEQLQIQPILTYNRWRDVRTAIDFLYNVDSGYIEVETPPWMEKFDPALHITKHDPVDDCIYDIMMLKYGKKHEDKDE